MHRDLAMILMSGILLFGCIGPSGPAADQPSGPSGGELIGDGEAAAPGDPGMQPEAQGDGTASDDRDGEDSDASGDGKMVLVLGRSVAYGWMEHLGLEWTCDDEECATGSPRGTYDGQYFIYYELEYPPEIASSAAEGTDMYGRDADAVFFKFCFVDFASDESLQNARDNERLVEDVYQYVAHERGKKLIIGNALPQVSAHTDPDLVANHREFNSWLDDFASRHPDVQVLDLYGTLADSNGNLRAEYAVSYDDSHLNGKAYDEITPEFMALLRKA